MVDILSQMHNIKQMEDDSGSYFKILSKRIYWQKWG